MFRLNSIASYNIRVVTYNSYSHIVCRTYRRYNHPRIMFFVSQLKSKNLNSNDYVCYIVILRVRKREKYSIQSNVNLSFSYYSVVSSRRPSSTVRTVLRKRLHIIRIRACENDRLTNARYTLCLHVTNYILRVSD